MRTYLILASAVCSVAAAAPGGSNSYYAMAGATVTDLGTLGGGQSAAFDINDSGQVVGWSANAQGLQRAFRYSNGLMEDVGAAFGPNIASEAAGINTAGQVAGTMTDQFGTIGFVWTNGGVSWLHPTGSETPPQTTHAAAINDQGDVGGRMKSVQFATKPAEPMLWLKGGPTLTLSPVNLGVVNDINDTGGAVGHEEFGPLRRWNVAGGVLKSRDLVPLPASTGNGPADAVALNNRGDVVGFYPGVGGTRRAFCWDGSATNSIDLGALPNGSSAVAEDINEQRFTVGHADEHIVRFLFDITRELGFIHHRDFGMYALPPLPATSWLGSCRAYALNERKPWSLIEVVGTCDTPTGTHAVRWDVTVIRVLISPSPWPVLAPASASY